MSHISWVQTLVKASGKKSNSVFFLPKLLLSLTSTRPEACLDLRLKSGALVPTVSGIGFGFSFEFSIYVNAAGYTFPRVNLSNDDYGAKIPHTIRHLGAPERRAPTFLSTRPVPWL